MPCLSALYRDRAFPSSDVGPLLFAALRRLASTFAAEGFLALVVALVLLLVSGTSSRLVATCGQSLPQSLRFCRTRPRLPILPDIYHLHGGEANCATTK